MVVCQCKRVREREIRRSVRAGAVTLRAVSRTTGAGSACRGCHRALYQILESERHAQRTQEAPPVGELETAG